MFNRYFLLVFSLALILFAYFYPLFLPWGGLLYYVIPSVVGLLLVGLLFNEVLSIKTLFGESLTPIVLLFLAVSIASDVVLGLLNGFGRNPLTLTQSLVAFNLVREVPRVLGVEFLRGYLLGNSRRVRTSLVLTSLFFTFLSFTYTRYLSMITSSYSSSVNFIMRSFVPLFLSNLLVGYLFILGGIKNSLIYSMFTRLYIYLMPLLPNVSSGMLAVVNVVQVFVFFVILEITYSGESETTKKITLSSKLLSFVFFSLLLAVLVSMIIGYRALVVVSGSMSPALNVGDVAVINTRVSPSDVVEGDVIAFYLSRDLIIHRVVRVLNTSSGIKYLTKGDANENPDPFRVSQSALLGKYVFKIPLVGYLWIYLMQILINYQNLIITVTLLMTTGLLRNSLRWFVIVED
ncbi:MAG: signal peptidase I [Zestosphaera sp.]